MALWDEDPTTSHATSLIVRFGARSPGTPAASSLVAGLTSALGTLLLLTVVLGAAGLAGEGEVDGQTLSIAVAVAGVVALALSMLLGGYVAGRVARYSGLLNGLLTALLFVLVPGGLAALAGAESDTGWPAGCARRAPAPPPSSSGWWPWSSRWQPVPSAAVSEPAGTARSTARCSAPARAGWPRTPVRPCCRPAPAAPGERGDDGPRRRHRPALRGAVAGRYRARGRRQRPRPQGGRRRVGDPAGRPRPSWSASGSRSRPRATSSCAATPLVSAGPDAAQWRRSHLGRSAAGGIGQCLGSAGRHPAVDCRSEVGVDLVAEPSEPPAESLLADALARLDVSVCIADARLPDLPLVWVNDAFVRTTGFAVEDVLGRNCRFLHEGLPPQPQLDVVRAALATRTPVTVVLANRRADGSLFRNELSVTPLHDDAGELTHYLAFQRDVTERVDAARDARRLQEEQSELTRSMQSSLVPPVLPTAPGLDVAVRYLPASADDDAAAAVSGDFYDLYAATGAVGEAATWNMAIGDVAGRGAGAAAYTATVRNLLKGIGLSEGSPARALELLNSALLDELGDRFVTVALAQLQVRQDAVRATLALGGHPQPVLLSGGEASLVGTPGDLLGVLPEITASDERVRLQAGDALLMYTDGITEAGPPDDMFGEDRLLEAAEASAGSAESVVDGVLKAVRQHDGGADGRSDDDSALLAVQADPGT